MALTIFISKTLLGAHKILQPIQKSNAKRDINFQLMVAVIQNTTASLYPANWPAIPFHEGEVKVQKRLGVHDSVMTYGPRGVRPFMPDQHREFYQNQPFLVTAARDTRNRMWATLLFASDQEKVTNFVSSPHPQKLFLQSRPLSGDALEGSFQAGSDVGILGIEFATRRRNRVNGRVIANDGKHITFEVDQSFGNCPQYIKPRDWWTINKFTSKGTNEKISSNEVPAQATRQNWLSEVQVLHIENAETIFVATGYRGIGNDPRFGNDASHRGGSVGFLKVSKDRRRIFLPDYAGNNMYMTVGNLIMDPSMGVTIPLYESGGMIQLSGKAIIHWEDNACEEQEVSLSDFPGALRWIEFTIEEVVELEAGSLPIRWDNGKKDLQLQVYDKVEESGDVTSFYLAPLQEDSRILPQKAGQHLTLSLSIPGNCGKPGTISRSYSVSNYQIPDTTQKDQFFRISVRRDPFGVGSKYLHDQVKVGDLLRVQKPAGDFFYDPMLTSKDSRTMERTVLFLSAGIGVTPILSMLHSFVSAHTLKGDAISKKLRHERAIWVQSVRNGRQHVFQNEVKTLLQKIVPGIGSEGNKTNILETFIAYTNPDQTDDPACYDIKGRLDHSAMNNFLSNNVDNDFSKVDVYMCGPAGFIATMEDSLKRLGVKANNIYYETF